LRIKKSKRGDKKMFIKNQFAIKLFTVGCILIPIFGCMKISKKKSDTSDLSVPNVEQPLAEPETQNPLSSNGSSDSTGSTDEFDFDVDMQSVFFHFPNRWPSELFVEIEDQNQRTTFPISLSENSKKTWAFKWPAADRSIKFIFRSTLDQTINPLKQLIVRPPMVIRTNENIDLYNLIQINSLFDKIFIEELHLIKGAQLYLQNFSGQVIINKIISESGSIQSVPTNQKAVIDTAGLSGGRVEFTIRQGTGSLTLAALGENGGDGSAGSAPSTEKKGRKGEDGRPAEFGEPMNCSDCSIKITNFACVKDPTAGFPGGQGLKGHRGHPGQAGGNSGFYQVNLAPKNLKINLITKEGRGGQGGAGGLGGDGGDGGESGDGDVIDLLMSKFKYSKEKAKAYGSKSLFLTTINPKCQPGRRGDDGLRGPDGDFGSNGADGLNERPD
jgi:hypothetical protein